MNTGDSIVLIGFRATGKSTVAALLADALHRPVIDTDRLVTAQAGRSIAEIFATGGEAAFRALERQVIAALAPDSPAVISVGGGAVLDPDNRGHLRAMGPVVWLEADVDALVQRLTADPRTAEDRPPLSTDDCRAETARLLADRAEVYAETCTLRIDTTALTPAAVCAAILNGLGL